jgi:hypothetical protein
VTSRGNKLTDVWKLRGATFPLRMVRSLLLLLSLAEVYLHFLLFVHITPTLEKHSNSISNGVASIF